MQGDDDDDGAGNGLHRGLIEAVPGGFVHVRADGSIADANPEALRILGLSFDELTKRYTSDFDTETVWEDGTPCALQDYPVTKALATGMPQPAATIGVRHPDGTTAWAVFRAVPLKSSDGEITGVVVTFLDITDRRRIEMDLQRSRDLLRWSQDIAHVGSWEWDVQSNSVRWTDELCAIHGIAPDAFEGTLAGALSRVHVDDVEAVSARTESVLAGEEALPIEYRILRPGGEVRTVWADGHVLRDHAGRALKVVGAVQDVTERRELEEQLRQTQRMDSIGQLAGGVAHDFNNMLQVILGNVEMAIQELGPHEELARVRAAAEHGAELTAQLLSFGRRQPVKLTEVELDRALSQDAGLIRRMLGERYRLRLTLANDGSVVRIDRTQLDQVLLNLCINARDAMPRGGSIGIATRTFVPCAEFESIRPWATAPRYTEIAVTDTGAGMDDGVRRRAFEPFFTTKAVGEGTGLGLSVVYGIAQQHGGMVEIESTLGEGSTLRIYLPVVEQPAPAQQDADDEPAGGGDETILVVEDDAMVRSLAVGVLSTAGYRVLDACGGAEALEIFDTQGDDIALVVSDVVMPSVDGLELAGRLRERRPDVRVLFTSGYAPTAATAELPVIPKPYSANTLLQRVRESLQPQ